MIRGVRARLTATIVALVVVTAAVLGVAASLFVDARLHQQALDDARDQARFDLSVLAPSTLDDPPTPEKLAELAAAFKFRGLQSIIVPVGGVPSYDPTTLQGTLETIPAGVRQFVADGQVAYSWQRLLDDVPDELIEELVAALEAEAAKTPAVGDGPAAALHGVLQDVGFGRSPLEFQWAAWGFAGGFSANVILAKYAQMTSGASMAQFIMPMLFGGIVAGAACGVIGWGIAKLRE